MPLAALSLSKLEDGRRPGAFAIINKHSFHLSLDQRLEVDLYARAVSAENPDLVVEVKDWSRPVGAPVVDEQIARKQRIEPLLERPAVFLIYSEHGFRGQQVERLAEQGILACDGKLLPAG